MAYYFMDNVIEGFGNNVDNGTSVAEPGKTRIDIDSLTGAINELNSAISSFSANVPLTTNTCAGVFAAIESAGFDTSSFSEYDSQIEEVKEILGSIKSNLQQYVNSFAASEEKIESEIPEEIEESSIDESLDEDESDIPSAEDNATAAVGDLKDSQMNASEDAAVVASGEVVESEVKEDKKDEKEQIENITNDDNGNTKTDDNNSKVEKVDVTNINNNEVATEEGSKDNQDSTITTTNISNINNKEEILVKCKENFSKISKEDLKLLLNDLYKKAMEKHQTLEEFLSSEKNFASVKDMLVNKSSLDKNLFNNLFNQDKKEFGKLIHDELLGSNNCLGVNSENTKTLKSYLTYEVSKKNMNLSDLLNNKGNSSELRSVLNSYNSKSNKFSFFVETVSGFDDKTMCYALKTILK